MTDLSHVVAILTFVYTAIYIQYRTCTVLVLTVQCDLLVRYKYYTSIAYTCTVLTLTLLEADTSTGTLLVLVAYKY